MNSSAKKKFKSAVSLVLVAALIVTGLYAFMFSRNEKRNKFTVGNVDIKLHESFMDVEDSIDYSPEIRNLKANEKITKAPWIENTGDNSAYVYMTVGIPVDTVLIEGNKYEKKVELLTLYHDNNGTLEEGVNENWSLLANEDGSYYTERTEEDGFTYRYYTFGYEGELLPGETTPKLFDKVQYANVKNQVYSFGNTAYFGTQEFADAISYFEMENSPVPAVTNGWNSFTRSYYNLFTFFEQCKQDQLADNNTTMEEFAALIRQHREELNKDNVDVEMMLYIMESAEIKDNTVISYYGSAINSAAKPDINALAARAYQYLLQDETFAEQDAELTVYSKAVARAAKMTDPNPPASSNSGDTSTSGTLAFENTKAYRVIYANPDKFEKFIELYEDPNSYLRQYTDWMVNYASKTAAALNSSVTTMASLPMLEVASGDHYAYKYISPSVSSGEFSTISPVITGPLFFAPGGGAIYANLDNKADRVYTPFTSYTNDENEGPYKYSLDSYGSLYAYSDLLASQIGFMDAIESTGGLYILTQNNLSNATIIDTTQGIHTLQTPNALEHLKIAKDLGTNDFDIAFLMGSDYSASMYGLTQKYYTPVYLNLRHSAYDGMTSNAVKSIYSYDAIGRSFHQSLVNEDGSANEWLDELGIRDKTEFINAFTVADDATAKNMWETQMVPYFVETVELTPSPELLLNPGMYYFTLAAIDSETGEPDTRDLTRLATNSSMYYLKDQQMRVTDHDVPGEIKMPINAYAIQHDWLKDIDKLEGTERTEKQISKNDPGTLQTISLDPSVSSEEMQTRITYKHIPLADIEDRIEEINTTLENYSPNQPYTRSSLGQSSDTTTDDGRYNVSQSDAEKYPNIYSKNYPQLYASETTTGGYYAISSYLDGDLLYSYPSSGAGVLKQRDYPDDNMQLRLVKMQVPVPVYKTGTDENGNSVIYKNEDVIINFRNQNGQNGAPNFIYDVGSEYSFVYINKPTEEIADDPLFSDGSVWKPKGTIYLGNFQEKYPDYMDDYLVIPSDIYSRPEYVVYANDNAWKPVYTLRTDDSGKQVWVNSENNAVRTDITANELCAELNKTEDPLFIFRFYNCFQGWYYGTGGYHYPSPYESEVINRTGVGVKQGYQNFQPVAQKHEDENGTYWTDMDGNVIPSKYNYNNNNNSSEPVAMSAELKATLDDVATYFDSLAIVFTSDDEGPYNTETLPYAMQYTYLHNANNEVIAIEAKSDELMAAYYTQEYLDSIDNKCNYEPGFYFFTTTSAGKTWSVDEVYEMTTKVTEEEMMNRTDTSGYEMILDAGGETYAVLKRQGDGVTEDLNASGSYIMGGEETSVGNSISMSEGEIPVTLIYDMNAQLPLAANAPFCLVQQDNDTFEPEMFEELAELEEYGIAYTCYDANGNVIPLSQQDDISKVVLYMPSGSQMPSVTVPNYYPGYIESQIEAFHVSIQTVQFYDSSDQLITNEGTVPANTDHAVLSLPMCEVITINQEEGTMHAEIGYDFGMMDEDLIIPSGVYKIDMISDATVPAAEREYMLQTTDNTVLSRSLVISQTDINDIYNVTTGTYIDTDAAPKTSDTKYIIVKRVSDSLTDEEISTAKYHSISNYKTYDNVFEQNGNWNEFDNETDTYWGKVLSGSGSFAGPKYYHDDYYVTPQIINVQTISQIQVILWDNSDYVPATFSLDPGLYFVYETCCNHNTYDSGRYVLKYLATETENYKFTSDINTMPAAWYTYVAKEGLIYSNN